MILDGEEFRDEGAAVGVCFAEDEITAKGMQRQLPMHNNDFFPGPSDSCYWHEQASCPPQPFT